MEPKIIESMEHILGLVVFGRMVVFVYCLTVKKLFGLSIAI
jgi:hypothetical protein